MVQLKHPSAFSCIGLENFNSIMVQLKPVTTKYLREQVIHFNSIMVQLKLSNRQGIQNIQTISIP